MIVFLLPDGVVSEGHWKHGSDQEQEPDQPMHLQGPQPIQDPHRRHRGIQESIVRRRGGKLLTPAIWVVGPFNFVNLAHTYFHVQ